MDEDQEEIFNFTIVDPMYIYKGALLGKIYRHIFDSACYPMGIVTDPQNQSIKSINSRPDIIEKGIQISMIIYPVFYTKEYLA